MVDDTDYSYVTSIHDQQTTVGRGWEMQTIHVLPARQDQDVLEVGGAPTEHE